MMIMYRFRTIGLAVILTATLCSPSTGSTDGTVVHETTMVASSKPECEVRHRLIVSLQREMTWENQARCAGVVAGLKTFVFHESQLNAWVYVIDKANAWADGAEDRGEYSSEMLFTWDNRIVASVVRQGTGDFDLEVTDLQQAQTDENRLIIPLRAHGANLQTLKAGLIPAMRAVLRN